MNLRSHLLLDEVKLPPSAEWAVGFACWCFLRVQQGTGYWLGGRVAIELGGGDVWVVPPQHAGTFRASQIGEVSLSYFLFCPELLSGLLTLSESQQLQVLAGRRHSEVRRFPPTDPVAIEFSQLDDAGGGTNALLRRSQMLHVAARFFGREWRPARLSNHTFLPANKRIKLLIQQLTEGEILNHSVAELALRCNCSPRHFNRLFMHNIGMSFRVKQAELRLVKARQMLSETDEKIAAVARAVGYRHNGLFNAVFKKQFGMSPTEWRHQARQSGTPANG